jgi:hypothetical protein
MAGPIKVLLDCKLLLKVDKVKDGNFELWYFGAKAYSLAK